MNLVYCILLKVIDMNENEKSEGAINMGKNVYLIEKKIDKREIMIAKTTHRAKILLHLIRVSEEIEKLLNEIQEQPDEFGLLENRLFWAIRGADPYKSICIKHNNKIKKNQWGEYVCLDCINEIMTEKPVEHVDDLWFDPDDKPIVKIDLKYIAD